MKETDKEYKLRCLITELIEWMEQCTEDFDRLCDCDYQDRNGVHLEKCQTSLMRRDIENFKKRVEEVTEITNK